MIGKLKGIIDSIEDGVITLDVGGVGYEIYCSGNTINQLPQEKEAATIFIQTHVREDLIHLYGFASKQEKQTFLTITKINGVGNKVALAILSVLTPAQLTTAIAAQDKQAFVPVAGVGPKLASRILTELKDKFSYTEGDFITPSASNSKKSNVNNDVSDAISALINLGYSRSDAYNIITKISAQNDNNLPVDALIREGLKELAG